MDSIRVRFLVTRVVQDHRAGTPDETRFAQGKVYSLPLRSARHWLNRGVAETVEDKPEIVEPAPEAVADEASSVVVDKDPAPRRGRRKKE